MIRLTRVDKEPEYDMGGCVICRENDFSVDKFDDRIVIICDQCEKEYHVGCLWDIGLCELEELPKEKWFYCDDFSQIYVALQTSVSTGAYTIPTPLSELIIRKHKERGLCTHELIPVMVYGRNISGQEFGGTYCIVFILNSIVVSIRLLRIFGCNIDELPLVATSREYQEKGDAKSIWTKKLGFHKMSEDQLSKYLKEGLYYFKTMKEHYGLEPSMDHYGAMVDLLGRAGKLVMPMIVQLFLCKKAIFMFQKISFHRFKKLSAVVFLSRCLTLG
ncbi:unnamed protein product [Vicia faba]|uniref:Increased DNA methylation 1 C-terminal domain-containing protein n=1 Tax=Vicia faba TaxID=3906 RepID=A0AAV0YHW4_VICFA|nr:unnamed protein product [Vicia faba]